MAALVDWSRMFIWCGGIGVFGLTWGCCCRTLGGIGAASLWFIWQGNLGGLDLAFSMLIAEWMGLTAWFILSRGV